MRRALQEHRSAVWRGLGVGGFLVLCVAGVTAYYFATVHEEFYFVDTGRFLDCGTVFAPDRSSLAVARCGGTSSGDLLGFVLMMLVVGVAIAAMVVSTIGERRRRR